MITLRPRQEPHARALLSILQEKHVAHDGSDVGVGKTYVAAWIAVQMNCEVLVICPLSVVETWRRVLAAAGVQATVINFESCWRRMGKVEPWGKGSFFRFARVWPFTIFDEAHRLGGDTSLQSKMGIAAKRNGGKVLTLSATAASTILRMKALGFVLGLHQLHNYRLWLFVRGVKEVEQKLRSGKIIKKLVISKEDDRIAMGRLHEEIYRSGGRGSRMRIADIPDFPQTVVSVRYLSDAPAAVQRLTTELQRHYRARTVLGALSPDEMAKLVFLRQASETAKIPFIIDMMEDALEHSRVVVFVNFSQTITELAATCEKRGWTYGIIDGAHDGAERQETIDRFQANQLDCVIANIQAGGTGLSLHDPVTKVSRTSIICPSWSAMELKQALGRVCRDGGGFSRQFLLYFANGVESRVAASVERKLDNLSLLNDSELAELVDAEPALL